MLNHLIILNLILTRLMMRTNYILMSISMNDFLNCNNSSPISQDKLFKIMNDDLSSIICESTTEKILRYARGSPSESHISEIYQK